MLYRLESARFKTGLRATEVRAAKMCTNKARSAKIRVADNTAPSGNDDSLVLRLRYGEKCFLFTGDIEKNAEAALVSTREDLRCDVVKVAHHGSIL